ncbi:MULTISPECIES: DUF6559 family protein [Pseudoalteromonas]|uniref:DUF6559 family protein n=1 Tax=Pseudoalteromonas neustonica TaxID=1840331 RepID=A0ABU9U8T1_9GAMM|nr:MULTISPECIES: DUF6559 family protein [unclassified Pseudoalteromonas]MDP2635569.1 hypothetical protein [Pseudoalteromonas sp. 1_MG-2023]PHN89052.1 hypothetical protein CSC79_14465 [Pseudoalteromonas sp. 3D05]
MFQGFFKRRKIKKYARSLPLVLKAQYGYKKYYTQAQVDSVIKRKRIGNHSSTDVIDNCYAYAMYCSPAEFKNIYDSAGESCDYIAMRSDVSDTLFNGVSDFSFATLLAESSNSALSSSGSFGGGDGGTDGGGGGGD